MVSWQTLVMKCSTESITLSFALKFLSRLFSPVSSLIFSTTLYVSLNWLLCHVCPLSIDISHRLFLTLSIHLRNFSFAYYSQLPSAHNPPFKAVEIQSYSIHSLSGNQSWIFIGRTHAEPEAPILWPLDAKNWLIWKDPDAGKDWRWEEKEATEYEMVEWHHQLSGHEFE